MIKTGDRFGRLTAVSPDGRVNGRVVWLCRCDCGNGHRASSKHLAAGNTKSCGCFRREASAARPAARAQDFASRLRRAPSGCLEWTGAKDRNGYGTLRSGRVDQKAHRVAFEQANGPIPDGMVVCHTCDNPSCCDPAHLFLGTHKDNKADSVRKRRHAHGVTQKAAKLTPHLVALIRDRAQAGQSQQKIADDLGVHQTTVSKVVRRASWTHIP